MIYTAWQILKTCKNQNAISCHLMQNAALKSPLRGPSRFSSRGERAPGRAAPDWTKFSFLAHDPVNHDLDTVDSVDINLEPMIKMNFAQWSWFGTQVHILDVQQKGCHQEQGHLKQSQPITLHSSWITSLEAQPAPATENGTPAPAAVTWLSDVQCIEILTNFAPAWGNNRRPSCTSAASAWNSGGTPSCSVLET